MAASDSSAMMALVGHDRAQVQHGRETCRAAPARTPAINRQRQESAGRRPAGAAGPRAPRGRAARSSARVGSSASERMELVAMGRCPRAGRSMGGVRLRWAGPMEAGLGRRCGRDDPLGRQRVARRVPRRCGRGLNTSARWQMCATSSKSVDTTTTARPAVESARRSGGRCRPWRRCRRRPSGPRRRAGGGPWRASGRPPPSAGCRPTGPSMANAGSFGRSPTLRADLGRPAQPRLACAMSGENEAAARPRRG